MRAATAAAAGAVSGAGAAAGGVLAQAAADEGLQAIGGSALGETSVVLVWVVVAEVTARMAGV